MIEQLAKKLPILNNLRGTKLAAVVKNSWLFTAWEHSVGNWFYPFLVLQWKLARLLTRRRSITVDGVRFTLPCKNWITHFRWYLFKTKEVEVREFINKYVQEGDTFFDIGANIGIFSVYAAKRYKDISVYSFEPEYSNLALLKENIIANQITHKVTPYSIGLSSQTGMSQLHLQDLDEGAAAHTESQDSIGQTDEGYSVVWREGIATSTLDDFCRASQASPNAIKIDTDGNELKILEGASETLKNPKLRSLVIEMPHTQGQKGSACEEILSQNGFQLVWSKKGETLNEVWSR